jgi:hypothetical protein
VPIVFAQPDPVAPQLSAAAGYAEEYAKLFPSIASLYGHQYAARQAGMNAAQGSLYQSQQNQVNQQNQAAAQTQQLQAQASMAQSQQTAQSQMADQNAGNDVWQQQQMYQFLQNRAWTAQDENGLAQAQNGLSQVMNDPTLSPQEQQQAAQQYAPYIQQQQQRKEMWQAKMQTQQRQLQAEQAAHLHAQTSAMDMQSNAAKAGKMSTMTSSLPIRDDDGELLGHMVSSPTGDGKWNHHFVQVPKEQKDTTAQVQQKAYDTEVKHRDNDDKNWSAAYKDAEEVVRKMANETVESKKDSEGNTTKVPRYPRLSDENARGDFNGQDMTVRDANILKTLNDMGFEPKKEDYLRRKRSERAALRGGTPSETQQANPRVSQLDTPSEAKPKLGSSGLKSDRTAAENAGRPTVQTPPPATPQAAKQIDEVKKEPTVPGATPFSVSDPQTDDQKRIARSLFDKARMTIGMTPPEAKVAIGHLQVIQAIVEKAGGDGTYMTSEQRKRYDSAQEDFVKAVNDSIRRRNKERPVMPSQQGAMAPY